MTTPTETLIDRAAALFRAPLTWVMPEPCAALKTLPGLSVQHSFRPDVLALQRMGIPCGPAWPETPPAAVALTLPRQVEWACGLLAQALEKLPAGGLLLAAARNDRGGKRYAALLDEHFGLDWSEAKNHCRLVAIERPKALPDVVSAWARDYTPKPVDDCGLLAPPGAFSSGHVDKGSALLARHLPALSGRVADFGAGWGYLSHHLLQSSPALSHIDLFEADDNALASARLNLKPFAAKAGFFWHDILLEPLPHAYDAVVMNPPFHDLQDANPAIGLGFIAAAAKALKTGGQLWMVANRHLPYEDALNGAFASVRSVADDSGFKIIAAVK